uniref:Uncharacterized protein n=1 Tax=viral metagenome TaxID=1070528 RepID=A0A6C0CL51_9ZZZZ
MPTIEEIDSQFYYSTVDGKDALTFHGTFHDDFLQAYKEMYIHMLTTPSPTDDEKRIFSKWNLYDYTTKLEYNTEADILKHIQWIHHYSIKARNRRQKMAFTYCYAHLQLLEGFAIIDYISTQTNLLNNYVQFGVEGTVENSGIVGIYDYILERDGTIYANSNGISLYITDTQSGLDNETFINNVYTILSTGVYPPSS